MSSIESSKPDTHRTRKIHPGLMFADDRTPAMVTFTYPDDWLTVPPSGASVKRHLHLWAKRFRTEWNETPRYIWKLEFQRRGAPHPHLGMAFPAGIGKSGLPFRQWCSLAWADVVNHRDPEQRARHLHAGTAVDSSKTGLDTVRRVCRRRQLCSQGGLAGGFALANNGPEFASQLARALSRW